LSAEIGASGSPVEAREPETIESCIARAADELGGLDGVANCIGSLLLKPAHLTSWPDWEETLTVNLSSSFAAVRSAVRPLRKGQGGSIVLVSTAAARAGIANHEAIAAAKAGVQGLALSAAATYAPWGIRVNVVAPGLMRTPLTARITGNDASLEASLSMHALKRIGEPEDAASCIEWLLSPERSWVTGQVFGIDGGLSTVQPRR
jgi:NAD(P)-dependent dehydrogenase (short-subunit alcohol dehydrogenase family)